MNDQPSRELAVPEPRPRAEIATVDTDSWAQVMRPILALAEQIYDTAFVPTGLRGSAPATAAAMLYGREVGLAPMTALNMTSVIEGKPGLSAEGMRALVLAAGHQIEFTETTGGLCSMRARRRNADNWTPLTWTIDMARAAGLTGKNNWKSYPRAMLQARCTTELCRMVFPDVIHGFRSVEELEDMSGESAADGGAPGDTGTTKVTRKRTAKKAAAAGPRQLAAADAPAGMPPLPGEPGYDDETPAGGEPDDGAAAGDDPSSPEEPEERPAPSTPPRPISRARQRMLMARFGEFGMSDDREERLLVCSTILGREVESSNDLSNAEASTILDTLANVGDREALNRLLDTIDEARAMKARAESGEDES